MENKTNVNAKHNDSVELAIYFEVWEANGRTGKILWDEIIFWRQKKKDLIDNIVIHVAGPQRGGLFLHQYVLYSHIVRW